MKNLLDLVHIDDDSMQKIVDLRKEFLSGKRKLSYSQLQEIIFHRRDSTIYPKSLNTPFLDENESAVFFQGTNDQFVEIAGFTHFKNLPKNFDDQYLIQVENYELDIKTIEKMEKDSVTVFFKQFGISINPNISPKANIEELYNLHFKITNSEIKTSKNFDESAIYLKKFIHTSNIRFLLEFNDFIRQRSDLFIV